VELNAEVPNEVWELLGPVDFKAVVKERPFNGCLWGSTLYDAIEVPVPHDVLGDGFDMVQWRNRRHKRCLKGLYNCAVS